MGNLDRAENTMMFCIVEGAKETIFDFSQGTVPLILFYFVLISYYYIINKKWLKIIL